MVECEDKVNGRMYAKVAYQFMAAMIEVRSTFLVWIKKNPPKKEFH